MLFSKLLCLFATFSPWFAVTAGDPHEFSSLGGPFPSVDLFNFWNGPKTSLYEVQKIRVGASEFENGEKVVLDTKHENIFLLGNFLSPSASKEEVSSYTSTNNAWMALVMKFSTENTIKQVFRLGLNCFGTDIAYSNTSRSVYMIGNRNNQGLLFRFTLEGKEAFRTSSSVGYTYSNVVVEEKTGSVLITGMLGGKGLFLRKLTAEGALVWEKKDFSVISPASMVLDSFNNIYLTGAGTKSITPFPGRPLESVVRYSVFFQKYNFSTGELLFDNYFYTSRHALSNYYDIASSISLDNTLNVAYLAGARGDFYRNCSLQDCAREKTSFIIQASMVNGSLLQHSWSKRSPVRDHLDITGVYDQAPGNSECFCLCFLWDTATVSLSCV
jgi:hypothetical protein